MIWGVKGQIAKAKLVSFDIFDTCLFRACPPTDVHLITGARLASSGLCVTSPMRFFLDRVCAEDIANHCAWAKGRDAATLKEIYDCLPVLLPSWVELDVEMDVSQSNPEVKAWYDGAVTLCKPVIFASDMYLPQDFLERLLKKHGFAGPVYVSCQVGCKTTGRMWQRILEDTGLRPKDVLHIGDHHKGDVAVPGRLGIKTHHYRRKA